MHARLPSRVEKPPGVLYKGRTIAFAEERHAFRKSVRVSLPARWIRFDPDGSRDPTGVCRGFARSQDARGAPICFWGRASLPVRLDDGLWAEPGEFIFALLIPRRLAPRPSRRLAWGLSPVVAALRSFGEHAYLEGGDIHLHGNRVAGGSAQVLGECVAVYGTFPADPPIEPPQSGERGRLLEFDPWLAALNREGRARQMLAAFRHALEMQHGWQFDTDWASSDERLAVAEETTR